LNHLFNQGRSGYVILFFLPHQIFDCCYAPVFNAKKRNCLFIYHFEILTFQMIVCSATLHNFEVKKIAEKLMYFPSWVDLKGLDSVPDTIHHCVCVIDPSEDREWRSLRRHVATDGVHATDRLNRQQDSKEMFSEAVKILKAEYCVRAIEKYNMDKALIFCRTKLDCDNLEVYLRQLNRADKFSCKFRCIKDFLSK